MPVPPPVTTQTYPRTEKRSEILSWDVDAILVKIDCGRRCRVRKLGDGWIEMEIGVRIEGLWREVFRKEKLRR